jgi:pimeloyl-ACP methyl ester carboxylesterase
VVSWVSHRVPVDGRVSDSYLAAYTQARDSGALVVFAHATGLHAHVFFPLAQLLADHYVVAYDARGHGSSSPGPDSPRWDMYGEDARIVTGWARAQATPPSRPVVGVGHSMGATALIMAALSAPQLFDLLIVVEPIVFPPRADTVDSPLAAGARRRRDRFPSFEAALDNFSAKPPLNSLDPRVLAEYVRHGFAEHAGEVVLRCSPEYEARTYEMGVAHDTWTRLDRLATPTLVVAGASHPQQPSAVSADIAARIDGARFERWEDSGHFAPLERPERFADLVRREIEHLAPTIS